MLSRRVKTPIGAAGAVFSADCSSDQSPPIRPKCTYDSYAARDPFRNNGTAHTTPRPGKRCVQSAAKIPQEGRYAKHDFELNA